MKQSLDTLATVFSLAALSESQRAAFSQVDIADAEAFVRAAYRECKGTPVGATVLERIAVEAERSDMSVPQWVAQAVTVYRWMEQRQLKAPIIDIIDYIGCACEGSALSAGHSIEWYLEQYGFERAKQGTQ